MVRLLFILLLMIAEAPHAAQAGEVTLTEDGLLRPESGKTVRLMGVLVEPEAARWFSGKAIELYAGAPKDRYGRERALGLVTGGPVLQEALLKEGLAFLYPLPDETIPATWLALENEARTAERGRWAKSENRTLAPEDTFKRGGYVIVEGVVVNAATKSGTLYLNFGEDWKTDFSVKLPKNLVRGNGRFYKGKRVRVRGYLSEDNGPMIVVSNSAMVEVLP